MNKIILCLFLGFSLTEILNGDKRLLLTDPQYAQNILQTFEVKLEQMNQKITQQDDTILMLKKNQTAKEYELKQLVNTTQHLTVQLNNATRQLESQDQLNQHLFAQLNNATMQLDSQEQLNQHFIAQLNNATRQLESHERLNQHLIAEINNDTQRLEAQENNYNHTIEKLEVQKVLNEHILLQDQQLSNYTTELTSKLSVLNNTVTQLSSEGQLLTHQLLNQTIASSTSPAFHVTLRATAHSEQVPVGNGHKVIFQNKPLDVGNGYNTQTGIYTVTRSGKYVITWMISIGGQFVCLTHLMVNSAAKGSTWTDGRDALTSQNEATTALVVLPLTVGDQLYINQFGSNTCTMYQDSYRQTSFSGWLLY